MNNLARENIRIYLESGENFIWTGQPRRGIVFEGADVFNSIFVLVMSAFTFYVTKLIFENISIFLAIFIGAIFFSGCFLLGIGRFFIDAHLRKKTFYALTNKRIIILSSIPSKKFQYVNLDKNIKVEFIPNLNGTSTIDVGLYAKLLPSGTRGWMPNVKGYTSLYQLSDGNFVHQKIKEMLQAL